MKYSAMVITTAKIASVTFLLIYIQVRLIQDPQLFCNASNFGAFTITLSVLK